MPTRCLGSAQVPSACWGSSTPPPPPPKQTVFVAPHGQCQHTDAPLINSPRPRLLLLGADQTVPPARACCAGAEAPRLRCQRVHMYVRIAACWVGRDNARCANEENHFRSEGGKIVYMQCISSTCWQPFYGLLACSTTVFGWYHWCYHGMAITGMYCQRLTLHPTRPAPSLLQRLSQHPVVTVVPNCRCLSPGCVLC